MQELTQFCALALPWRKKAKRKYRTATVIVSEILQEMHFGYDDGYFTDLPDCLDVRCTVPVLSQLIFGRDTRSSDNRAGAQERVEFLRCCMEQFLLSALF